MIVDDWEDVAVLLRRSTRNIPNSTTVEQVLDVPEAMPAVQRLKPHVVILDLRLPSGSGLSLIQQVKNLLPASTVMMFSGYVDTHAEKAARELGADYFFHKSDDFEKMVETLTTLAGQAG